MNCLSCLNCGIREKAGIQIIKPNPCFKLFRQFFQRAEETAA